MDHHLPARAAGHRGPGPGVVILAEHPGLAAALGGAVVFTAGLWAQKPHPCPQAPEQPC
ncbi:hypothetical protein [Leisingera sp.]|uniref:hypothetical protein n=1 Tax=Leisingera sp. TaxID=1879318 RepID=UPI002B2749DA|nr:hypothetical protein [Leisingera sp.]